MSMYTFFEASLKKAINQPFKKFKYIGAGIVFGGSFLSHTASAELDFNAYTCSTPGEQVGVLPNSHKRVMAYTYHNGYLISHDWGSGTMRNYDMADPSAPVQVGGDQTPGNGGHHHFMGVGTIVGFNWAGLNQTRLDDVPEFSVDSIVDGTDEAFMVGDGSNGHHSEMIAFYPYGFGNVPTAYEFDNKPILTIHDLRLPGNPKVGEINVQDDLGFQGRVNMVGNLLIVRGDNLTGAGVGVYDIADPANPVLLDKLTSRSYAYGGQWELGRAYDTMPMFEHYIVNAMNGDTGFQRSVDIIDYSDPTNLRHVSSDDYSGPSLRYPNFKDDHMYVGEAKVDMNTFKEVESFSGAYGEFLMPIGNVLIGAGQDRTNTARVFCNESQPDTRAPTVGWSYPRPNATNMHVKGRVGVLIHETLDINTINDDNFQILNNQGQEVAVDVSWWSNQTINITPKEPLNENETYQFFMRADGVRDVAGNGLAKDYRFHFSTGDEVSINHPPVIEEIEVSSNVMSTEDSLYLNITASDADGDDALSYYIEWGDGGVASAFNGDDLRHKYGRAGIYFVAITVSDSDGGIRTQTIRVVVEDDSVVQHLASSTIVYSAGDNTIINVNPDNNTVSVTQADDGGAKDEYDVGNNPYGLALDADDNIWVANKDDGTVTVLEKDGDLLHTIMLHPGAQPVAVLVGPDNSAVYVTARAKGSVYKINTASGAIIDELPLGPSPHAMAMTHDGSTLLVTRFISPQNEAQVYRVKTSDFSLQATISIAADTTSLDTNTSARGVMNNLASIVIRPNSDVAWVTGKKDNVFRGLVVDGNFGDFQNTVRSAVAQISLVTNQEVPHSKFDIDNAEIASAIAFSYGGQIAYITHQGNNHISAYNLATMQGIDLQPVGNAPKGLVVLPDRSLYVHNFLSRSVTHSTAFSGVGNTLSAFTHLSETTTVANEQLTAKELEGKRLFYDASDERMSKDGYMSCATCHNEGGSDHRVYDFTDRGEGLRNTISMIGRAGTGHGRVHWSANFDEIQDFEHDMRGPMEGAGFMDDDDFDATNTTLGHSKAGYSDALDAIAVYAQSLDTFAFSPYRNAGGALTSKAQKGKLVFEAKGCADCHGGEAYTDSPNGNRHDVGTITEDSGLRLFGALNGIDTPTLRGIWDTAPYLHDGSAATLHDVLNNAGHGSSDTLTTQERNQLVAYLQQIDGQEPAAAAIADALTITSLSNGEDLSEASVDLTLSMSLAGVSQVEWVVNDVLVATKTQAPFNASYTASKAGLHRVYARALYNNGKTATLSPEVTVKFNLVTPYQTFYQAENMTLSGLQIDPCGDSESCLATGWADAGDSLKTNVNTVDAGQYVLIARYASALGSAQVSVLADGVQVATFDAGGTGGWDTYKSKRVNIDLPAGVKELTILHGNGAANFNWFKLQSDTDEDGVAGNADLCELTPPGQSVDSDGCVAGGNTSSSASSVASSSSTGQSSSAATSSAAASSSAPATGDCNASNATALSANSQITLTEGMCLKYTLNNGRLQVGSWNNKVFTVTAHTGATVSHTGTGWHAFDVGSTGEVYLTVGAVAGGSAGAQFANW